MKKNRTNNPLGEMMTCVRRHTKPSPCLDIFEQLLGEINDEEFTNVVVSDFNKYLTEVFELFKVVDRVPQKKYTSRMLTVDFIKPKRFFSKTRSAIYQQENIRNMYKKLQENYLPIKEDSLMRLFETFDKVKEDLENHLTSPKVMNVIQEEDIQPDEIFDLINLEMTANAIINPDDKYTHWIDIIKQYKTDKEMLRKLIFADDIARKKILVFNYIPALIKAVLQDKRRSMRMDNNSKRFD